MAGEGFSVAIPGANNIGLVSVYTGVTAEAFVIAAAGGTLARTREGRVAAPFEGHHGSRDLPARGTLDELNRPS